jgi:DNA-binding winged helix-turn-helix (wHTH) protein/Tol biopolymer transport system component
MGNGCGKSSRNAQFKLKDSSQSAMLRQTEHFYDFSPFRLDLERRVLLREGKVVPLTPKLFDTLLALVERHQDIVSKDELLKFVWPDSFVEEGNLTQNISMLRKLLGENADDPHFIETIPRRGYRFVAEVREIMGQKAELASQPAPAPDAPMSNAPVSDAPVSDTPVSDTPVSDTPVSDTLEPAPAPRAIPHPQINEPPGRRIPKRAAFALLALGIGGLAYGAYLLVGRFVSLKPPAPKALTVNRLTYTGKASRIAISPDGKYVAEAVAEGGKQSLWLRQVVTASEIQIAPPAEVSYVSLIFSADGNFIYFVRGSGNGPNEGSFTDRGTLYKMPVLGKSEKKLLENVDSHITLSPDGEWLAFMRRYPKQGKSSLILARTDGSGEKELATRKSPDDFLPGGPAWSPDGKIIACTNNVFTADTPYRGVVGIRVADGSERPIGSKHWYGATRKLAWLADGSGLLVLGAEYSRGLNQVWRLSYPGDEAVRFISDLNNYADLSLTADARTMAVVRADRVVNLWVAPEGDAGRAKLITSGTGREDGVRGLTWTHDGRLVYRSMSGEAPQIWIIGADGSGARQLTIDGSEHFDPEVSPDGRYIVWSSSATGQRNIWRMGLDGSNPTQITQGSNKWFPQYTPDGNWLLYVVSHSLAKVSAEGGAPALLTKGGTSRPTLSPDGKWVAYNRLDEASGQWQIAVLPINGEAAPRIFDAPSPNTFRAVRWTPDGRGVAYAVTADGVSNIWSQPLDGGPPSQLTRFKDQLIFDFAWSRDGKLLALSRGSVNSDVVLVSDFR